MQLIDICLIKIIVYILHLQWLLIIVYDENNEYTNFYRLCYDEVTTHDVQTLKHHSAILFYLKFQRECFAL